jgi:hypothetical protein
VLEVSEDGSRWATLSGNCTGTTTSINVQAGRSYAFRLQASDRVSNAVEESASLVYSGVPPQVSVEAIPGDNHIDVTWNASDPSAGSGQAGSGVAWYDLDVRVDDGAWERLLSQTLLTAYEYAGHGHRYTFRVTVTDNTGNTASAEASAAITAVTKYYYFPSTGSGRGGGQRVAMRKPDGAVNWLHGDHLGSTSLATDGNGGEVSQQLYYPFGEVRWASAEMPTDFGYTRQRLGPLDFFEALNRAVGGIVLTVNEVDILNTTYDSYLWSVFPQEQEVSIEGPVYGAQQVWP